MTAPVRQAAEAIDPCGWAPYLDPGERLLWEGRPATGIRLGREDLFLVPFGLLFLGFALFWIVSAAGSGAGWIVTVFGLPFVAVGAFVAVGRLFWDAHLRRRTRYALTDRRAMIARSAWGRSLRSYPIDPGAEIELRPGPESTVIFARETVVSRSHGHLRRGPGLRTRLAEHGFRHIPDGEKVYSLIRAIQRAREEDR